MNTRFCPTCNGDASLGILHLGHVLMCKANSFAAHSTGGRFIVRFDDNQAGWVNLLGQSTMWRNAATIRDELDWLGVRVDEWQFQSTTDRRVHAYLQTEWPTPLGPYLSAPLPIVIGDDSPQYPYSLFLTAETVLLDWWSGVDCMIAGDELRNRWSLYSFCAQRLGIPFIQHVHLPRLKAGEGAELSPVSKTAGNHRIADYRAKGFSPTDIDNLLRGACLIDATGPWDWRNVKAQPRLPA